MTDTHRKRDPRYTRTVGEKPNQGRRYAENGKVRIEWTEDGKRRSKTIGPNNPKTRREADEELEKLLGLTDAPQEDERVEEDVDEGIVEDEVLDEDITWLVEGFRHHAEALMDLADELAESVEKGLIRVLNVFKEPDSDEAVKSDEPEVDEEVDNSEDVD